MSGAGAASWPCACVFIMHRKCGSTWTNPWNATNHWCACVTMCSLFHPPPPLQFGVFLPHVELFDAELFSTMRTEAVTMDPQQRLLLHAAHAALSCAGAGGPAAAFGRAVGAYVGIAGAGPGLRLSVLATALSCPGADPSVASSSRPTRISAPSLHCPPCSH